MSPESPKRRRNSRTHPKPVASLSKIERRILYGAFPVIVAPLIRAGYLDRSHLNDAEKARDIIGRRSRFATARMKWSVGLESGFARSAAQAWRERRREEAIVLLAVALEQCVNVCLRLIVEANGHRSGHVTEQLRLLNIEAKLGWFFEMTSGRRLPTKLGLRARKIFEVRNSIVHYKAVFGHPDSNEDSYSKIRKEIAAFGKFRPQVFFQRFCETCWTVVARCDPTIELAIGLREKLLPHREVFRPYGA